MYKCHIILFLITAFCFYFQAHLLGVFENVNEVEFHEKDYDRILSVISREGETIPVSEIA